MKAKGEYGYISNRRIWKILKAAAGLVLILLIYFLAQWYFGSNRNVFTIIAVLLCIPEGMWIVSMIMFMRAKGCSPGARSLIEIHDAGLPGAYDLYLTGYDKNYQLSHAVAASGQVCAYTETAGCDIPSGEAHIRKMVREDGHGDYDVRIFRNLERYLGCLDELEKKPQDREKGKAVLRTLYAVSL